MVGYCEEKAHQFYIKNMTDLLVILKKACKHVEYLFFLSHDVKQMVEGWI